jgi:3-oxoacyl-(acyl-carrier-protein) synthase
VITGLGVVSGFGAGVSALWDGLARGERGIRPITSFDASGLPLRVAGQVPVEEIDGTWLAERLPAGARDLAHALHRDGALRDRKVAFGMIAAAEAWHSAGLGAADRGLTLLIASGIERALMVGIEDVVADNRLDWGAERAATRPRYRLRAANDLAVWSIARMLGSTGPVVTHISACAAGAMALGHAASLIERGDSDLVLCGATDAMLDVLGLGGMALLGTTSSRADALDACRPFDKRRDGLVIGEGAALFVVEHEQRARARGARPLAVVLGSGTSQDGYRPSAPDPDGTWAAAAMRTALGRAGIRGDALGYINAHGTGTALNDVSEVRAIHLALAAAATRVPVSSIKGAVGHLMAAAGAIELAGALMAFDRDLLPGTAGHTERDPECDLDVIGELPRRARVDALMSNSFGFGGQNCAVVLGRCG